MSSLNGRVPYVAPAVTFDGTNDYLTRGADLTGSVDTKKLLFSAWVYFTSVGATQYIFYSDNAALTVSLSSAAKVSVASKNSAGTFILSVASGTTCLSGQWYHLLFACDLTDTGKRALYINGAADSATWTTYTNDSMDVTRPDHAVGAALAGTVKLNAHVADMYLAPDQYLDLSVQANREKFRSRAGKPVYLGTNAAVPTGTQPLLYLQGSVSGFATNKGSGGGFSVTGALLATSLSPSL